MVAHVHGGGCCGGHPPDEPLFSDAPPNDTSPPHAAGAEISVSGDGGVIKSVIVEGTGGRPPRGFEVEVHYVGTLEDGTKFDSSRDRDSTFRFVLGEGNVIKGWDLGVATMSQGEKCTLTVQPEYGYGEAGAGANIPPNAVLKFEVELINFRAKPKARWSMSIEEKIQAATDEKEKGNEAFKKQKISEAIAAYREGICFLECSNQWTEGQQTLKTPVEVSLRLNLSNCYVKTGEYSMAIDEATLAIKLDSVNTKAWYRRGVARAAFGLLEEARVDLTTAAKLDPKSVEIRNELIRCKGKLIDFRQKEKSTFGSMFNKVGPCNKLKTTRTMDDCVLGHIDIRIGDNPFKRMIIALYYDTVPHAVQNFLAICSGDKLGSGGQKLDYRGTLFTRVIKGSFMQGGDIESCAGELPLAPDFREESSTEKHSKRGQLSMIKDGANESGSTFLITFAPTPEFDGKNVVFGEIMQGVDFLDEVEALETDSDFRPEVPVVFVDGGPWSYPSGYEGDKAPQL